MESAKAFKYLQSARPCRMPSDWVILVAAGNIGKVPTEASYCCVLAVRRNKVFVLSHAQEYSKWF